MHKRNYRVEVTIESESQWKAFSALDSDPDSVPLNEDPERPMIAGLSRPDMRGLGLRVRGTNFEGLC